MLFAVGFVVVVACVLGGFLGAGGHLTVLWQPYEYLIIFGASIGAYVIANPKKVLGGTAKSMKSIVKGPQYDKASYIELLSLLYAVFKLAKTKGDLALESHIDSPTESILFQNYPKFIQSHEAVEFLCDYLRLLTLGSNNPHELETIIDADLEAQEAGHHAISGALQTAADGLPALGIVAAVLGVIHTMGSITEPPEVLGHLIGGALVGTFSGVLFAYGIVSPMAKSLETTFDADHAYLECIKIALLAHVQGYAPQVAIEFARKTVALHNRPTFIELDQAIQTVQV